VGKGVEKMGAAEIEEAGSKEREEEGVSYFENYSEYRV